MRLFFQVTVIYTAVITSVEVFNVVEFAFLDTGRNFSGPFLFPFRNLRVIEFFLRRGQMNPLNGISEFQRGARLPNKEIERVVDFFSFFWNASLLARFFLTRSSMLLPTLFLTPVCSFPGRSRPPAG